MKKGFLVSILLTSVLLSACQNINVSPRNSATESKSEKAVTDSKVTLKVEGTDESDGTDNNSTAKQSSANPQTTVTVK